MATNDAFILLWRCFLEIASQSDLETNTTAVGEFRQRHVVVDAWFNSYIVAEEEAIAHFWCNENVVITVQPLHLLMFQCCAQLKEESVLLDEIAALCAKGELVDGAI